MNIYIYIYIYIIKYLKKKKFRIRTANTIGKSTKIIYQEKIL